MTNEEARALLYNQQRAARCQAKCSRIRALAGKPAARLTLSTAWQPLYLAALEADGVEDFDCLCPDRPYDPDLILA